MELESLVSNDEAFAFWGRCLRFLFGRHLWQLRAGLGGLSRRDAGSGLSCCTASRAWSAGWFCDIRVLQRRLVGRGEKPAAITAGVVNELPLVVVILLIKYPNAFFPTCAGYSNHGAAAESLRAGGRGSRTRSTGSAGRSWTRCG